MNLGDNPGDLADTTYLAADDSYTSLVERRGWSEGYSTALVQHVPLTGRATGTTCDFSTAADSRIGGNFGGNLGRKINQTQRGVSWDEGDVYGYCADDPAQPGTRTPMVVVPLTEQDGFFIVTERPAGYALYNGKTGQLDIRTDTAGSPAPSTPSPWPRPSANPPARPAPTWTGGSTESAGKPAKTTPTAATTPSSTSPTRTPNAPSTSPR